jgi:hypothetical protein
LKKIKTFFLYSTKCTQRSKAEECLSQKSNRSKKPLNPQNPSLNNPSKPLKRVPSKLPQRSISKKKLLTVEASKFLQSTRSCSKT